jgi:hypothetical protein
MMDRKTAEELTKAALNVIGSDDDMTSYAEEIQVLCRLVGTRKPGRVANNLAKLRMSPQDVTKMLNTLTK